MTEANSTAAAPPIDLARSTPGEYLRRLREEKGHTHAAVGSALHLTVHYIKALEGDEYGKLPGLTFVKGYLRSYARFLGADVDNVLARFDEHITGLLDAGMHTARVERSRRRQDQALRWAIGAGLVVVVGLAAGWWFMRDAEVPAAATAQRSVPVAPEVTASVPPAPQPVASAPAVQGQFPNPATGVAASLTGLQSSIAAPNGVATGIAGVATDVVAPVGSAASGLASTPAATGVPAPAGAEPTPVATVDSAAANTPVGASTAGFAATAQAPVAPATDAVAAPAGGQGQGVPSGAATTALATNAAVTMPTATGARQVALIGAGNDELRVSFKGNSWIEVDDGNMVRLYNDMLSAGDTLTIRGVAPFRVLLGDAASVELALNAMPVDFSADIRADSTARLVLGAPSAAQPPATPTTANVPAASPAAQPASDEVTQ